jgi:cytochrome c-type biogenesis protein CcmH/NrfG
LKRGAIYFTQEKYPQAVAEWEKALSTDPNNQEASAGILEAKKRIKF